MKAQHLRTGGGILVIIMTLLLVGVANAGSVGFALPTPALADASLQTSDEAPSIRINEVAPNPSPGQYEWVELYRSRVSFDLFFPRVLRTSSGGAGIEMERAVQRSGLSPRAALDISGWQISDQDGNIYTIPDALPPVPQDAFVLIYFDGTGPEADDYDFSDGKAVLHTPPGLVDVFEDDADQVALYTGSEHTADTLIDFVAYGDEPGEEAADAIAAGLWPPEGYTGPTTQIPGGDVLTQGGSIGIYPGDLLHTPDAWVIYAPSQTTPGAENPAPAPYFRNPPDGIATTDHQITFGWSNVPDAVGYRLEVDDDPNFGSPELAVDVDVSWYTPTTPFPDGTFYYRVKARRSDGSESGWSATGEVTFITVVVSAAPSAQVVLGVTPQLQHKDSRMICLDGHNETGQHRWDSAHEDDGDWTVGNGNAVRGEPHDDMYCTRAAISMIVDYFGGHLSQDRISYFHFGGGTPDGDLGHGTGLWPCESGSWGTGDCVFGWALNNTAPTSSRGKPTFNQARGWIDAGRPILIVENNDSHSVVMDGYDTNGNLAHRVDPWTGTASWVSWNTWNITEYHVPPAGASVRSDETSLSADTDSDGIVDFDEINRFHTSPTSPDSDGDWVPDKQDLREYVFTNAGAYNLRNADVDGDGLRKELDADNDNDGSVDGCEDTNYNGKYEAALGETDNFNAASHQACVPLFDILQPTQANPTNAGAHNNPDKILIQVKTATPPSSPVTYTPSDFDVEIGGQAGTVVAVYQVADTHFLVVSPPTQSSADYYDLQVTLQGTQTDTETRAVYYLPRLRADQVLVIDRSGSMNDYDKMDAAKNAARAFVDHANVGDMIGVASFASSAGINYPLTTITGDPEWNAAKTAVNGLSASGTTALGQGALAGYNELNNKGQNDHDWAMVLLSDGMENVTPYWSDASVSGVIVPSRVVVHTVALGYDADETLLSSIAGQTGGTFYAAGTDILPASASGTAGEISSIAPLVPNIPDTLPNRLADIYKSIAEQIGHQQRLWERMGALIGQESFEVPVEEGVPEAIFTVNWDNANQPIIMELRDPDGDLVKPGYPGMTHQTDATHDQYRIRRPKPGVWAVILTAREKLSNYLFMLSAWSPTTMHLAFGVPASEMSTGVSIPILVVLADRKPITGAEVTALVQGPDADLVEVLQLYDDGAHQDGKPNDGVYGNLFNRAEQAGTYVVKAVARGVNNQGEPFMRYRTGSFYVRPRVAYIWREDLTTAQAYQGLLESDAFVVDLIQQGDDIFKTPWRRYSLIVIGPDTGSGSQWGTQDMVNMLLEYRIPALGLGEGGYAFFGKAQLTIGFPNGWHISERRTLAVDATHQVWHSPHAISLDRSRVAQVYKRTAQVGIHIPQPSKDITLIGREPGNETHYNIVQQTDRFLLWGFQAGPSAMTEDGRHLFINVARYLAR
ncbi:MAG TPA: VWA domain-containing protein [Caldilineae bacterium]|nr:VWA domain-containing protein [Caldilineae bacterium]